MDILNGKIKTIYFKYLLAAFGSTLIPCIYSVVDMAMVGKYHGPDGPAALAVFAPLWNVIYGLGLLAGIGGAVIFSTIRGSNEKNKTRSNEIFTVSIILGIIFAALVEIIIICFNKELFYFFGADKTTLILAQSYLKPILFVAPLFLFNQLIASFLRNDGNPGLATIAVLSGGIFNMFGDWLFVFPMNMGIFGAGLATALGSVISFCIMLTHFISKKNTMYLAYPRHFLADIINIIKHGFSTGITDFAAGALTILFNRQIIKYLGTDALAVFGIIVNIRIFVLCCASCIGQASQPLISMNYGANKPKRIQECLKYAIYTSIAFGIFWTVLSIAFPNLYVYIFMKPTDNVLTIAPYIIRVYGASFLLLPFNLFSTYYFQSILQTKVSLVVSLMRGIIISGFLVIILPVIAGAQSLWYSMVATEVIVAVYVTWQILKCTRILNDVTDKV